MINDSLKHVLCLLCLLLVVQVFQGGAQVVWMDRISVLDHKHLPSAHCGAPGEHTALSARKASMWTSKTKSSSLHGLGAAG